MTKFAPNTSYNDFKFLLSESPTEIAQFVDDAIAAAEALPINSFNELNRWYVPIRVLQDIGTEKPELLSLITPEKIEDLFIKILLSPGNAYDCVRLARKLMDVIEKDDRFLSRYPQMLNNAMTTLLAHNKPKVAYELSSVSEQSMPEENYPGRYTRDLNQLNEALDPKIIARLLRAMLDTDNHHYAFTLAYRIAHNKVVAEKLRTEIICKFGRHDSDERIVILDKVAQHARISFTVSQTEDGNEYAFLDAKQLPKIAHRDAMATLKSITDDGDTTQTLAKQARQAYNTIRPRWWR